MPGTALKQTAFERGDMLYIVAPVVPHQPSAREIDEYAFAKDIIADLRREAPNEHIAWFGGHYVQGDCPNLNGAMWLSEDLAIASLTPMMMPVTVMHDPRSAVGVIAHVDLQMPQDRPAKIETALALWRHRFPDVVAEAEHNYKQGTLMQSMECIAPRYACSHCRMPFIKEPKGAERARWCEHLKASQPTGGYFAHRSTENANASRILMDVTFTGTGLIFGSRGAVGADPGANLELFREEVAEFHAKAHRDSTRKKPRPSRSKRMAEIDDREYAELLAARTERDTLKARIEDLEGEAAKIPDLERKLTETEAAKAEAEQAKAKAEEKVTEFEERANRQRLRDQRWEALGGAFTGKLDSMPTTKANLLRDAEALKDEDWDTRLAEIEELAGVKRDAQKEGGGKDEKKDGPTFTREEVAAFRGGGGSNPARSDQPSLAQRQSVVGALARKPAKKS